MASAMAAERGGDRRHRPIRAAQQETALLVETDEGSVKLVLAQANARPQQVLSLLQ